MALGQQIAASLLGHTSQLGAECAEQGTHTGVYLGFRTDPDLAKPPQKASQKPLKYENFQTLVRKFSAQFQLRLMGTRSQSHRNGFVISLCNLYLYEIVAHFL